MMELVLQSLIVGKKDPETAPLTPSVTRIPPVTTLDTSQLGTGTPSTHGVDTGLPLPTGLGTIGRKTQRVLDSRDGFLYVIVSLEIPGDVLTRGGRRGVYVSWSDVVVQKQTSVSFVCVGLRVGRVFGPE